MIRILGTKLLESVFPHVRIAEAEVFRQFATGFLGCRSKLVEMAAAVLRKDPSTSDMEPIPSLRIFPHPPVSNGVTPILNPLIPTPKFDVKIGKGDTIMSE